MFQVAAWRKEKAPASAKQQQPKHQIVDLGWERLLPTLLSLTHPGRAVKGGILEIATQSIKSKGHRHFLQELIYSHFTCSLMRPVISGRTCAPGFRSKGEAPLQASLTRLAVNVSTVTDAPLRWHSSALPDFYRDELTHPLTSIVAFSFRR